MQFIATVFTASAAVRDLGHLLDLIFGSNMTYALLLHIGAFENRLDHHLDSLAASVNRAQKFVEEDGKTKVPFAMERSHTRCLNMKTETKTSLMRSARRHSALALGSAGVCIVLLLVGAFFEIRAYDWLICVLTLVLFLPVPRGLSQAHQKVTLTEARMTAEYDRFFVALDLIAQELDSETREQLEDMRAEMNRVRPSPWARLLFWVESDSEAN